MTDLTAHEARQALAEIAASEAVSQKDFDAICDDYPRLLAEWDEARALVEQMREALGLAVELLDDAWNQFAVDGNDGKWAGGLSTLERIADELPALRALAAVPDPQEPGQ